MLSCEPLPEDVMVKLLFIPLLTFTVPLNQPATTTSSRLVGACFNVWINPDGNFDGGTGLGSPYSFYSITIDKANGDIIVAGSRILFAVETKP
jgi:hypothetical protein